MTTLASSSATAYATMMNNLRRGLDGKADNLFLLDFERVKNWLETNPTQKTKKPLSRSSIKTYYSAIINAVRSSEALSSVLTIYQEELKKYIDEFKAKEDEQMLTEEEKTKWLSWKEIEDARIRAYGDWRWNKAGVYDPELFQDYLILSLYTKQDPIRLDYAPMRFVEEAPKDSIENFCVLKDGKATFVLNSYKTANKYGTFSWEATEELSNIIVMWRSMNKTEWFLRRKDGEPMTSQQLGLRIKDIFTRLTGKGATINIIRHAYRTNLHSGEPSLTEQKEISKRMGHSVVMGQRYRRIDAE